jgi:hypothetical protein
MSYRRQLTDDVSRFPRKILQILQIPYRRSYRQQGRLLYPFVHIDVQPQP